MTKASFLKKACGVAAGAACMLALSAAPARAVPILIIDFDNISVDGGIVTATAGGNFVGTNIIFDSIFLRIADPADPTFPVQNLAGVQCGNNTSTPGDPSEACVLNFDTSTGAFSMIALGGLYDIGADMTPFTPDMGGQILGAGQTVLAGSISSFQMQTAGSLGIFSSFGSDVKNPALLRFFGVSATSFTFANTEITLAPGGGVQNADLTNTPVPEPGSLGLLGLGMLAAGRAIRRRRQAKA